MSFWLVFATPDSEDFAESEDFATNAGLYHLGTWVEGLPDGYPALAELIEEGGLTSAEDIAALEAELTSALKEKPGKPTADVLNTARRLLEQLKTRPEGTNELAMSDGTEGDGDDDEDDQDEDGDRGPEGEAPPPTGTKGTTERMGQAGDGQPDRYEDPAEDTRPKPPPGLSGGLGPRL
jgi:hypothetical protein